MRAPSQRSALGALFLVLTALFGGIAFAGFAAGVWPVGIAAAAIGAWLLSLAARGLSRR